VTEQTPAQSRIANSVHAVIAAHLTDSEWGIESPLSLADELTPLVVDAVRDAMVTNLSDVLRDIRSEPPTEETP
jgi:hypothetical protein